MENTKNTKDEEIEISLYDIMAAIYRKKVMIMVIVVIAVAAAVFYLSVTDPVYQATSSVMVSSLESGSSTSLDNYLAGFAGNGGRDIATEVSMLTSRRTVQEALDSLDMTQYETPDGVRYSDLENPLTAPGLIASGIITVGTVSDTNIVNISVRNTNPEFARDLANAMADAFNTVLNSYARGGSSASIAFVESQIPTAQAELAAASQELADFQRSHNVMQTSQASQLSLSRYNYLVSRRAPLELEIQEAETMLSSAAFGQSYESIMARSDVAAVVADLRATLQEILAYDLMTLASSSLGVGSGNSSSLTSGQSDRYYILVNRQQSLERNLEDIIVALNSEQSWQDASFYASAMVQKITSTIEISLLDDQAAIESANLESVPELEMQLARLQSNVSVYQTLVVSLMQMQQEAQLRDAAIDDNVMLIDEALLPVNPVSPNKLMILAVAVVLGGFVGVGLALLMELSDQSVFSSEDLRKTLPMDVPFLGWIPMLKVKRNDRYIPSVVHASPNSFESEKYKVLASNIVFGRGGEKRIITVCSADKNEGKTSVMVNVAVALTQNGFNVLLVDGDLRMPSCEHAFNLEHQERGLVDVVMEGEDLDSCIVQPIADVDHLHLLPCGTKPAIPSMVYASPAFNTLLDELKGRYDIILFDAPPLAFASELLALAKHLGEVLIVTRAGISSKSVLVDMIENLQSVGATVIGACLNAVIASHGSNKRGYGSYSYSYSSNLDPAMKSVVKKVPWLSSRKMYYRKRYRRDERYRTKMPKGRKVRPNHPLRPDLDIPADEN